MMFSPHVFFEKRGALLHRFDRPDVAAHQDRHRQERRDREGKAQQAGDPAADDPEALLDEPQDEADRRGDRRVADDLHDVRARDTQAVAHGRVAAVEPDHGRADQRRIEEEDDEVLDQVEHGTRRP